MSWLLPLIQLAPVNAIFGKAGTVTVIGLSLFLTMMLTFKDRSIAGIWEVMSDEFYLKTG